jgi:hypothetical protein
MITKKDFAEYIIEEHAISENVNIEEIKEHPIPHVFKSTACGLALEYLGLLDGDKYKTEREYLSSRAGSFISIFDKNNEPHMRFLSVREMLQLLPEKIE